MWRFLTCGLVVLGLGSTFAFGAASDKPVDRQAVQRTVKAIREAVDLRLPLAGSWNTGTSRPGWIVGKLIEHEGHMVLPWFQQYPPDRPWNEGTAAYYGDAFAFCAKNKLPIALRVTQWENELLKLSANPPDNNPCVIGPDGKVTDVISPFGPVELWYKVGYDYNNGEILKKLQAIYPDPPLVVFATNHEAKTAEHLTVKTSKRLAELVAKNPSLANDPQAIRKLIADAWTKRYQAMLKGLRDALVSKGWKQHAIFIPYSGFNNAFRVGPDVLAWRYPHVWGGNSTRSYTSNWDWRRDFTVGGPQGEAGNVRWSIEQVRTKYPDFFNEVSVWYDGPKLVKQLEMNYHESYTPERYRGILQYVMWVIHPQSIREFRSSRRPRKDYDRSFHVLMNSIDRIHENPVLRRFWLEGKLVPNNDQTTWPKYTGAGRWFVLKADANKDVDWGNIKDHVPVFALALVMGQPGQRQWLVYAHSPEKDRKGVTVMIPEYRPVTIDAPIRGAYYLVSEQGGAVKPLGPFVSPDNRAPVAHDDTFAVGEGGKIVTTRFHYIGIGGVLRNDDEPDGDPMHATVVTQPKSGKLAFHDDGTFTYQPRPGFTGEDGFTYRISDGAAESSIAHVALRVRRLDRVADGKDRGFTSHADWRRLATKSAFGADMQIVPAGADDADKAHLSTATWTFSPVSPGTYKVYATWPKFSYHMPRKVRYTIEGRGKTLGTVEVDQSKAAAGETADGHAWHLLGTYRVGFGVLKVVLDNSARGRWVMADAVRIVPERGKARVIDDGDKGYRATGKWFTTKGYGGSALSLRGQKYKDDARAGAATWTMTHLKPGLYEVFATWTASTSRGTAPFEVFDGKQRKATVRVNQKQPPDDLIAKGVGWRSLGKYLINSGTLEVRLTNNVDKGTIIADAVAVSDLDEFPGVVVDDGPDGKHFASPVGHAEVMGRGHNGDSRRYNNGGKSRVVAAWRLPDLTPGQYHIYTDWQPNNFSGPGVTYEVLAGGKSLGKVVVDQNEMPDDRYADGVWWKDLGAFAVPRGGLEVRVWTASTPNKKTIADAVWAVPVKRE